MKLSKRIISVFLLLTFVAIFIVPAMASEDNNGSSKNADLHIISNYVGDMYPKMFESFVPVENSKMPVFLGNKLSAYRVEDNGDIFTCDYEVYPVILNDSVVGIANVIRNNTDVYQVSCGIDFAPELQKLLSCNQKEAFALLFASDGVYIVLSSGTIACIRQNYISGAMHSIDQYKNIEFEYASITKAVEITYTSVANTRAVHYNSLSPITNVPNASTECCPGGICGHAYIATMTNYFQGTSRTAISVHDTQGCLTSNYHDEVISFLVDYGLSADGPNYTFNYSNLKTNVDNVMFSLLDLQATGVAHYVIAHGYYWDDSITTRYFYYTDPNHGGLMSSFPESGTVFIGLDGHNYSVHCYTTVSY